jgi:HAD superfamily hydrolase (TIGR01509 family)
VQAWVEVLGDLGVGQEALGEARLRSWVGVPDVAIVAALVREQALPLSVEELLARKRSAFRELIPRALNAFPGVGAALSAWDGVPVGMATATARREAELMLATLGLRRVFRVLVTGDEVARPKPAPDCYRLAVERLGLAPRDCVAVEDAPHGVQAAKTAGLSVLGVLTSFAPQALAAADRLFPTVLEAVQWLEARVGDV